MDENKRGCAGCGERARKIEGIAVQIQGTDGPVTVCPYCAERQWWTEPGAMLPRGLRRERVK